MKSEIFIKVPTRKIAFLTKIIEGYDNLGVVSTIDPDEGIVRIMATPNTLITVRNILESLPFHWQELTDL